MIKKSHLKKIITEEIKGALIEMSPKFYEMIVKKIQNSDFSTAMKMIYNFTNDGILDKEQFKKLITMLTEKSYMKNASFANEGLIVEMSLRDIKDRIREILDLEEVQKYKVDEFTYENIPFQIFEMNGILPMHLKQYKQSSDIITFDLGLDINPIKKNVDVFLQKSGIFN